MIENLNIDFILLNLKDIVDSTKMCIINSSKSEYMFEYKDNLYSLMNILDSVDLIEKEIDKYFDKSEPN